MDEVIKEQEDESNVENEMANYMDGHSGSSNSLLSENLQNMLADRYDTKWWVIVVYDHITGHENHYYEGQWHFTANHGKRNALSTSYRKRDGGYHFDQAHWTPLMDFLVM